MTTQPIRRVAIELTGIYLVKQWEQNPQPIQRQSFETITLLANPQAIAQTKRYCDQDLNRCFAPDDLANPSLLSYENQRAQEIARYLGPREAPQVDVIIDLHSTTANMGLTLIPASQDPFNLRLAAYLQKIHPSVRTYCGASCDRADSMLRTLSPWGCTIEVGAIAQGVLHAEYLKQTETLIHTILDYLDALNQGHPQPVPSNMTIYQELESIDYPRNASGELQAMIHPQRQFKDYQPLQDGDPMFLTFTGESIPYRGQKVVYPVFINEAAYYEKKIAMILTDKQDYQLVDSQSLVEG
jgi:succinylglutamate desuccinylase